ncbi:TPR and ankyrin repeat-containing protein 1 isoform X4 [Lethenteron reissneri]|nr:TPR and ankyrin repeat-containing protein 1 isoform X4 [Lethenteron reissneri]
MDPVSLTIYLKGMGNNAFQEGCYLEALQMYEKALQVRLNYSYSFGRDVSQLFCNMAMTYIKLGSYADAVNVSRKSIDADQQWYKGYYRLGEAYAGLGEAKEAVAVLQQGLAVLLVSPDHTIVHTIEFLMEIFKAINCKTYNKSLFVGVLRMLQEQPLLHTEKVWHHLLHEMAKQGLWKEMYIVVCTPDDLQPLNSVVGAEPALFVTLYSLFQLLAPGQEKWIYFLVTWLISHGAKPASIGANPLHAVMILILYMGIYCNFWLVNELVCKHGMDINDQDAQGQTVLHLVARTRYSRDLQVEQIKLLLLLGASIHIRDISGFLPYDCIPPENTVARAALDPRSRHTARPTQDPHTHHTAQATQDLHSRHTTPPTQDHRFRHTAPPTQDPRARHTAPPTQDPRVRHTTRPTQNPPTHHTAPPTQDHRGEQQHPARASSLRSTRRNEQSTRAHSKRRSPASNATPEDDSLREALEELAGLAKRPSKRRSLAQHPATRKLLLCLEELREVPSEAHGLVGPELWTELLKELLNAGDWRHSLMLLRGGAAALAAQADLSELSMQTMLPRLLPTRGFNSAGVLLQALLHCGVRVNGRKELPLCVLHGEIAIARLLLEHGADPAWLSLVHGDTPLHAALNIACSRRDEEGLHILKLLLEKAPNVNVRDADGNSLLHLVFSLPHSKHHNEILRSLASYRIDHTCQNKEGRHAFWGIKQKDPRMQMWNSMACKQKGNSRKGRDGRRRKRPPERNGTHAKTEAGPEASSDFVDETVEEDDDDAGDDVEKVDALKKDVVSLARDALAREIEDLIEEYDPVKMQTAKSAEPRSPAPTVTESPLSVAERQAGGSAPPQPPQPPQHTPPRQELPDALDETYSLSDGENARDENSVGDDDDGDDSVAGPDFNSLTWEIECTRDALRILNDKSLPHTTKRKIVRVIYSLGNGDWHLHRIKQVKGIAESSEIRLFEARLDKAARLLWELAIDFSPRCSAEPEKIIDSEESTSGEKTGEVYSEIIRIWDIVLEHKQLDHRIKRIISSYNRGTSCLLHHKLKGIERASFPSQQNVRQRYPLLFVKTGSSDGAQPVTAEARDYFPPASTMETEYNIMKFHTFSTTVALNVLRCPEQTIEYPFRVGELEHAVINLNPTPLEAIILIGRSGTGKTTCLMYRLWNMFDRYWQTTTLLGEPWIPKAVLPPPPLPDDVGARENVALDCPVKNGCVDDSSRKGTCELEREACLHASERFEIDRGNYLLEPGAEIGATQLVSQQPEEGAAPIYEHLHQLFVTKNQVLSHEVQRNFVELSKSTAGTRHYSPINISSVCRLQDVKDDNFPLFLNSRQLLLLLDASLANPFFARNEDGSLKKAVHGWSMDDDILDLNNAEDAMEEDPDNEEDHQADIGKFHESKKEDPRKFVTYEVFTSDIWPAMVKGKSPYNPAMVWMEIKSFIKGSMEALKSPNGVLGLEHYKELGQKRAPNFTGDRGEVHQLFRAYQHVKSQRCFFDEEDLVFHIYSRLCQLEVMPWSIHELYGDEIQDFTQAELALLMRCCADPNAMFLTGDTAQSIMRGVAFRFSELRSLFHFASLPPGGGATTHHSRIDVRKPKRLYELCQNYRSHSGILEFASSIVDLLQHFFPESLDWLPRDQGLFPGPRPILLDSCSSEDLAILLRGHQRRAQPIEFGAHQVILVCNEKAKEHLPEELSLGLVLTIYEAKGLEFDDVLLYNFFSDSEASKEWRVVNSYEAPARNDASAVPSPQLLQEVLLEEVLPCSRPLNFDSIAHKVLISELKHLYTAVTRARVNLWVFDDHKEKRTPMFRYLVRRNLVSLVRTTPGEEEALDDGIFVRSSTPEEWNARGDYFFKHRRWKVAAKCYHKGGDAVKEKLALAHDTVLRMQSSGWSPRKAQDYLTLAKTYLECGLPHMVLKCLQNAKSYPLCGRLCERLGKVQEAVRWYMKSSCYDEAARLIERCEAEQSPDGGLVPDFPWKWRELRFMAARHHVKQGDEDAMMRSLSRVPFEERLAFLKMNNFLAQTIALLKQRGRVEEAGKMLRKHGMITDALQLARPGSQFAAECLLAKARAAVQALWARASRQDEGEEGEEEALRGQQSEIKAELQSVRETCENNNFVSGKAEACYMLGKLESDENLLHEAITLFLKADVVVGAAEATVALLDVESGGSPHVIPKILKVLQPLLQLVVRFLGGASSEKATAHQEEWLAKSCEFYGLSRSEKTCRVLRHEGARFLDVPAGSRHGDGEPCVPTPKADDVLAQHLLDHCERLVRAADSRARETPSICRRHLTGRACPLQDCRDMHGAAGRAELKTLVASKVHLVTLSGILLKVVPQLKSQRPEAAKFVEALLPKPELADCEDLLALLFPSHFHLRGLSENPASCRDILAPIRSNPHVSSVMHKLMAREVGSHREKSRRESTDLWLKMYCAARAVNSPTEPGRLLRAEEEAFYRRVEQKRPEPGSAGMVVLRNGRYTSFFNLFTESVEKAFAQGDVQGSTHAFYRFHNLIKTRQGRSSSLAPSVANTAMMAELQLVLVCALHASMRPDVNTVCLPHGYLATLNLWSWMHPPNPQVKHHSDIFKAIHEFSRGQHQPSGYNRMVRHVNFLALMACGEHNEFLLKACNDDLCVESGAAERLVVLYLVMLVNIHILRREHLQFCIRTAVRNASKHLSPERRDRLPPRLLRCLEAADAAKGPRDVTVILDVLLTQRDDERLYDCVWSSQRRGFFYHRLLASRFPEQFEYDPEESGISASNPELFLNGDSEERGEEGEEYEDTERSELLLQHLTTRQEMEERMHQKARRRWRAALRALQFAMALSAKLREEATGQTVLKPARLTHEHCGVCGVSFVKVEEDVDAAEWDAYGSASKPGLNVDSAVYGASGISASGHYESQGHVSRMAQYHDYVVEFRRLVDPAMRKATAQLRQSEELHLWERTDAQLEMRREELKDAMKHVEHLECEQRTSLRWDVCKILRSTVEHLDRCTTELESIVVREVADADKVHEDEGEPEEVTFKELDPVRKKKRRPGRQRR